MGGNKGGFNTNRSEFVPENVLDGDIEIQRTGGCFVTTKKAIGLVILALLALAAVGTLIYFYGTKRNASQDKNSNDIEILINESLDNNNDFEDLRLPSNLVPLHYHLRIHPYLDEPDTNSFIFTGRVKITMHCIRSTKKIVLNTEDLEISKDDIVVATAQSMTLKSMSQVVADYPNGTNPISTNVSQPHSHNLNTREAPNTMEGANTMRAANTNSTEEDLNTQAPTVLASTVATVTEVSAASGVPSEFSVPTVSGLPSEASISTVPSIATTPSLNPQANVSAIPKTTNIPEPTPSLQPDESNTSLQENFINPASTTQHVPSEHPITERPLEVSTNAQSSTESSTLTNYIYKSEKLIYLKIKNIELNVKTARYVINLMTGLQPGVNYTLDIKFSGTISNNLVGLYKTSYLDSENHKRWLVTTQFQPIFARRAFPCFDEPSFKSTYEISIGRRTNMTALSNMPLKESEPMVNQTGWIWDHFEKSPPMSSYLVAFTVCDFESLKPNNASVGPVFKIWTPKQSRANALYATEIGPKIISYLQEYFGVKYPLSKIDLVAIPELPTTATENWGLVSFRDTALLLDPNSDSWETRNYIFKTVVRKLTAQWFGNLVTMDWWSDLWLSEGFATYMEDLVENAVEPTLEDLDTFALRITQAILDSDKLKSVRSLHVDIKDPTQIEQLFDDFSSNKGSCLIRMLNYTLTEEVFKEGVQNYLKNWTYKSTNQGNFWESLTRAAAGKNVLPENVSVKQFMDSWIKQEGYPVITVTRDYETGNVLINQSRFVHGNASHTNNLWHIPLTYTKQNDNGSVSTLWLKKEESLSTIRFMEPGNSSWIIFNIEQAGFYRVNYDITNWRLLQNQLMNDPTQIMAPNRGQLLNDAFELANAGILDYETPFELTKYLPLKERNYIPWHSVYHSLQILEINIGRTQYNGVFQKYIINMVEPMYKELGTSERSDELQNDKLLRNVMIKEACNHGYEPCVKWANEMYQEWMASPDPDKTSPIPFDSRIVVQCSAIKMGGQKEWDFLWQRTLYHSISPANLKIAYLSLGCTREPWLITSYLERSLNGSVAIQNVPHVWKSIGHPAGINIGFTFLRTNWDRIYDRYEHVFSNIKSIFEDLLSKLSTETDLEDLTSFYKDNKENLYQVSSLILSVVDRIKWRIYWAEMHMKTVATWLAQNTNEYHSNL